MSSSIAKRADGCTVHVVGGAVSWQVSSDAVGGAATDRSGQLAVGGSAECRHHMIVWGRGTVENQNGASSRGHF